jgi:hypothetical protein
VVLLVALLLGINTSNAVGANLTFLGWVVGLGGAAGGVFLLNKLFAKRVIFKRRYRTR